MKFIFNGYEFDTELEYLTTDFEIVNVETYDDKLMKVTKVECGSWYTTNKNIFIDTSKLSAPEKAKIVPEDGKAYHIKDSDGDEFITWWFDIDELFRSGHRLENVEIICEMVEKV